MGRKSRLSKDQLRKAKKKQELARRGRRESLAYSGNKYRTEEYVHWIFAAEAAINEVNIVTGRRLTDQDVERSLEAMISGLRRGTFSLSGESKAAAVDELTAPDDHDAVIEGILVRWRKLAENEPRLRRDDLAGVLRTILGSLETWRTAGAQSRGYLTYVEGFLKKLGVEYIEVDPGVLDFSDFEEQVLHADDDTGVEAEDDEVDDLLHVGRVWCHEGEPWAAERFRSLADGWIGVGNARHVVETCQRLLREADPNTANRDALAAIAIMSQPADASPVDSLSFES